MDMCMIDLTDLPQVGEGDEVEVYGPHASVGEAADLAGMIPYGIVGRGPAVGAVADGESTAPLLQTAEHPLEPLVLEGAGHPSRGASAWTCA